MISALNNTNRNKAIKLANCALCLIILFCSCHKEDSNYSYATYKFDGNMKPYVFGIGTYWIYEQEDSIGHIELDSWSVISTNWVELSNTTKFYSNMYTGYKHIIFSSLSNRNFELYTIGSMVSYSPSYESGFFDFYELGGSALGRMNKLKFDTLVINSVTYKNGEIVDISSVSNPAKLLYTYVMVPGIGIIKRNIYLDKTKTELVRYKMVAYTF